MTFGAPYLLLSLLAVPLAIVLWRLAERRRMRYAVRYTNVDVLASVAGGRAVAPLPPGRDCSSSRSPRCASDSRARTSRR